MELWNEARDIPRYDVSSWGQVFDKQIFPSTGAVDRYRGVSPGSVSKTLRGLQPTCKGYTFERIGGEAHDS